MSNGIAYQLPSSHLFIHRVPTKLSNRVLPYGVTYCQLQLLFILFLTDLPFLAKKTFQWTLFLASSVGPASFSMRWFPTAAFCFGFLLRNPARFRFHPKPGRIPPRCFNGSFYAACAVSCFLLTISPSIFSGA